MDLTKEEMGEWLADKVLKVKKSTVDNVYWFEIENGWTDKTPMTIEDFIYSPHGFFAVWDAVEKRRGGAGWSTIFKVYEDGRFICTFEFRMNPFCMGKGKDRYEAFYNAVYKATKTPAD